MTHDIQRGFTIIELLLFFSISGLMFVALMAGVSTNINSQRYKDGVTTFAGVLQQQYSEVSNTRNDRDDNWRCDTGSIVTPDSSPAAQARGTTECVILGRYVRAIDGGQKIETGNVVGLEPATSVIYSSDIEAFLAYQPAISIFGKEERANEWGVQLRDTSGTASNFAVLILRSPQSGLVRVFAESAPLPTPLSIMMTPASAARELVTCVIADGWTVGATQAVVLKANIAGPNGVETRGDTSGC